MTECWQSVGRVLKANIKNFTIEVNSTSYDCAINFLFYNKSKKCSIV